MTAPKQDYKSFFQVVAAQSVCARCDAESPIVWVRKETTHAQHITRNYIMRERIGEKLLDVGWEIDLKKDKAFCPSCRRIGK